MHVVATDPFASDTGRDEAFFDGNLAGERAWPSAALRAPPDRRAWRAGCWASCGIHGAVTGVLVALAWLGLLDMPAEILGRRAVVTMEAICIEGRMDPVTPEAEPQELPSQEPLDVSHATEPLKIEVTPDHVRIQEQVFQFKTKELLRPELEVSTLAAGSPAPQPQTEHVPQRHAPHRHPERTENPQPRPRMRTDVLAAVTPPAIHIPAESSAGIEEIPARLPPNNPPPIFPAEAVARGWYGRVELRVTIAPNGTVARLEIAASSGYPVLDGAAYQAVRHWRFEPGRRAGAAVQSILRVPVDFLPRDP